MKLWLIKRDHNGGYDTYDSAVVAAETEDAARHTHPSSGPEWDGKTGPWSDWAVVEHVTATLLGEAIAGTEAGVVCASFNAG